MSKNNILIIGSSNTDMVIKTKKIPVPGETIIGGTFLMNPGGKGANQAVAAARLNGKVTFVAKCGIDLFGTRAIELLMQEGIDSRYIVKDRLVLTGTSGRKIFLIKSLKQANTQSCSCNLKYPSG
jgi:ribokinase